MVRTKRKTPAASSAARSSSNSSTKAARNQLSSSSAAAAEETQQVSKRQKKTDDGKGKKKQASKQQVEDEDEESAAAEEQLSAEEEEGADDDDAAMEEEDDESDMDALVRLESSILGADEDGTDGSAGASSSSLALHYNSLVKIIQIADKLNNNSSAAAVSQLSPDELAVGISAVQAAVRVYTGWLASGDFVISRAAAKKKEKHAALQALQGLLSNQYKKLWSILLSLLQCDVEVVQSNALHAAMDLVQAEGSSAAASATNPTSTVTESLSNGSFNPLLRVLFLSPRVHADTRAEFIETFVSAHADLRANVYLQFKSLVHLPPADWVALCKEHSGNKPSPSVGPIVRFLLGSDWSTKLDKNWIVMPSAMSNADEDDDAGFMNMNFPTTYSSEGLKKLFSEIWLGVLKHKMPSVEIYKDILIQLHSVIIPTLHQPLLLADFLTDSYNVGGIVSLLALNGLFILISKFNLDYPSFFKKLYACCKPYVFHAKYRARFFQLVSLFLTSGYLPSYLVCAFVKRFARLSLTAPPAGAIFCIAVIYNLLRRHPVCRPLINRALSEGPNAGMAQPTKKGETLLATERIEGPLKPVGGGILSSLANLLNARQTAIASGTLADPLNEPEENEALRLTLPVYVAPPPSQSLLAGHDSYIFEQDDPELSNAADSSLWEIKSLTEHFSPTVSNLAKVFFTTHAPKKDLEMNKYIEQSYQTLFTKETDRRANQKVQLQTQVKFTTLFSDAAQSIGLTFQLPSASSSSSH